MAMQFNMIAGQSVTKSPMDFSYQFGLNDNSTQYFNYTDYSIITNATTDIESTMTRTMFESTLLNGFPKDTVVGVEISSVPIVNLQWTGTLSLSKVSTEMSKEFAGNAAFAVDIAMTTLSAIGEIGKALSMTGGSEANSIAGAVMAGVQFASQVASSVLNIIDEKKTTKAYEKYVNKMVELYNEKTEANYEFIEQAKEEFQKRSDRFERASQTINSKQKSRSKSF